MPETLRIVIAGGGTGGHILPGLAIARELRDTYGADVRFIGTSRGLESRMVPPQGFPLAMIASGPLKNVSLDTRLRSAWAVPHGVWQCMRLLRQWRSQVVISVGGYAAGPAMAAAWMMRVPCMIFEPNAAPGLTNRIAARWARAAAVNFADAAKFFRNAQVTGIPVRQEFFSLPPRDAGASPHLLLFGGSQGARILNEALIAIAPELLARVPGLTILHQTGARNADAVAEAYAAQGVDADRLRSAAFLDNMADEFARADLVLARSGASTVAELGAAGKPAVLVPFAAAADDHQTRNAEAFAASGAAIVIRESDLSPDRLLTVLTDALNDRERLKSMCEAAKKQAKPDAAGSIAAMAVALARQ